MLVTSQNCTTTIEVLLLLYNLHIFASDQIKEERNNNNNKKWLVATFEQLSLQKATFEQLFEKLRATFWEISSNLWKALIPGGGGLLNNVSEGRLLPEVQTLITFLYIPLLIEKVPILFAYVSWKIAPLSDHFIYMRRNDFY